MRTPILIALNGIPQACDVQANEWVHTFKQLMSSPQSSGCEGQRARKWRVRILGLSLPLFAVLQPAWTNASSWPGLPPDCWTESRMVHSAQSPNDVWKRNISIITRQSEKLKTGTLSPNKGYMFVVEGGRPSEHVIIFAEKDHLIDITIRDLVGLSDIRWVNEKLILMRIWWGRMTATDMLFDVETENVLYAEMVTDGTQALQQYRESCLALGCTCIKKG